MELRQDERNGCGAIGEAKAKAEAEAAGRRPEER